MTTKLPAEQGFYFPAEYAPHAATWMGWPFDDEYWEGFLEEARADFTRLISTIARFEKVYLACGNDEAEKSAKQALKDVANIRFYRAPLDDIWFRDIGALFVKNGRGELLATDWRFNGWGNKFRWEKDTHIPKIMAEKLGLERVEVPIVMEGGSLDINGQGVCLTTRQCLLNQNRNPNLNQTEIETYLKNCLGVKHVIWLAKGLEGDKTDGHVDTLTRWAADDTIITSICEDKSDSNYAPMQENLTLLKTLRQPNGQPYKIIELPLPKKRLDLGDERLPLTYANFYIGNGFVVMPTYKDENDGRALGILQQVFQDREVMGLPSLGIISGGGSFHCVTQQEPKAEVLA